MGTDVTAGVTADSQICDFPVFFAIVLPGEGVLCTAKSWRAYKKLSFAI